MDIWIYHLLLFCFFFFFSFLFSLCMLYTWYIFPPSSHALSQGPPQKRDPCQCRSVTPRQVRVLVMFGHGRGYCWLFLAILIVMAITVCVLSLSYWCIFSPPILVFSKIMYVLFFSSK